jgi:hypothetical protein
LGEAWKEFDPGGAELQSAKLKLARLRKRERRS